MKVDYIVEKIVEFPDEGITIYLPKNYRVKKNKHGDNIKPPPSTPPDFIKIRDVIDIAFYKKGTPNVYETILPNIQMRVRYLQSDMDEAKKAKKYLVIAWWDGKKWHKIICEKIKSKYKHWAGYGDATLTDFGDPPIAWGQ